MTDIVPIEQVVSKIYFIRGVKVMLDRDLGVKVMLDRDLADLYEVETKVLKRNVRRHLDRFPDDFMFELSQKEYQALRSQVGTLKRGAHSKYLPFALPNKALQCYPVF